MGQVSTAGKHGNIHQRQHKTSHSQETTVEYKKSDLNGEVGWAVWFPYINAGNISRVPQINPTVLHKVIINRYFNCLRVTTPTIPLLQGEARKAYK
jgi:hypothetical protein